MDILNYIKDCKEKGYEAETILKGLEVKLEFEKDTSENWEFNLKEKLHNLKLGVSVNEIIDYVRKTREEAKEEGRKEGYDVGFCQGSSDTGLPNCLIDEYKKQSKSELIDGLIKWARDYRNKVVSGDIDAKGVKISDAIMIYNAVEDDLIQHLKSLININ